MSVKLDYNITKWDALKLNYWGIPKCMNTSAKIALLKKTGRMIDQPDLLTWAHREDVCDYITQEEALNNGNRNVTIIREPIRRFKSMWTDYQLRGSTTYRGLNVQTPTQMLTYIRTTPRHLQNTHIRSQTGFLHDGVLNICRSFNEFADMFDLETVHSNGTTSQFTNLSYDDLRAILDLYADDVLLWLGYSGYANSA